MWKGINLLEPIFYTGRWNYTQVCYLEHQPEVRRSYYTLDSFDLSA
jgi:hypothetical protein